MTDKSETSVELVRDPMMPALGVCADCVFAGFWPPAAPGGPNRLVCRRFPPSDVGWIFITPEDWCGEFKRHTEPSS